MSLDREGVAGRSALRVGALATAAGTLVFFWPVLFGRTFSTVAGHQAAVYPWYDGANAYADFPQSDQADLSYPWQAFVARSLASGDLPLWNPLSFGGQPFFSNGSSAVLYLPRLPAALLLSPSAAHDFLSILHVFGGGLAMLLLCRRLGIGTSGSLFGASSWMFASFNMAWLHLEVVAPVTVLLPLSLLLVGRAIEAASTRDTVAAAFVLGTALASGHVLVMGALWAVAIGYGVWCAVGVSVRALRKGRRRSALGAAARLAALAVGGPALFAVVLLPTAATIGISHREPLTYEWVHESIRSEPGVLLNVLRPPPLPVSENSMNRQMVFIGSLAGALALVGVFRGGRAPALGRAIAVIVLLLAFDTPVLKVAYQLVPGFTLLRPLGRLFFLLNLATALLAAAGLEALAAGIRRTADRFAERGPAGARGGWVRAEAAVVAAIIVANTAQLIAYGWAINPPFHPRTSALLFPPTPLIDAARNQVAGLKGRLLPLRRVRRDAQPSPPVLLGSQHMVFGLPSFGGYDSVVPAWALHLCLIVAGAPVEQVLENPGVGAYLSEFPMRSVRFDLLPRLGVTALVGPPGISGPPVWSRVTAPLRLEQRYAGEDGELYRVVDTPGDAWLATQALLVDSPADALRKLTDPGFAFDREVILLRSDASGEPPPPARATSSPAGEARVRDATNNRLVIEVESSRGGWLVVPHTWDPGWRARLDGRPAPLFRANYAFRAVRVPGGKHRVEMSYWPVGLTPGLLCSAAAALAAVMSLSWRALRRRRESLAADPLRS